MNITNMIATGILFNLEPVSVYYSFIEYTPKFRTTFEIYIGLHFIIISY